ncbi:MAG TPA: S9 family peptidase, partial [Gemmatimonadales bacterium]|nr:S9 family peptidase [Gemmatimonadales bacterium]
CALMGGAVLAVPAASQAPDLSVATLFGSSQWAGNLVTFQWDATGGTYTVLERTADGATDLYRVDAVSGRRDLLLRGTDLIPAGGNAPIAIEEYRFSQDGTRLLIFTNSVRVWRRNTKGIYFVWDFSARRLMPVSTAPGFQQYAKFSPDGRMVGFVRENDLYLTDLASGRERRLTRDGGPDIINGATDWVYEEELDLRDGFRFSPDGRRIAFWRFDQSPVSTFYLMDELSLYPELLPVRYPKAGRANSQVRLGVVEVGTGETRWIDYAPRGVDAYLARMDFAGTADSVWFLRLHRRQNRVDLVMASVQSGASRVVMTDRDSAWVDVQDPVWLNRGAQFLYLSERDGFAQLHLFGRDGGLIRKVTAGPWDVLQVHGVDEPAGAVYFTAAADGPLVRPLYRIGLDGRGFRRVSDADGSHSVTFDPTFSLYVDSHSRAGTPPVQRVHRADGTPVRVMAENRDLRDRVAALGAAVPEFLRVSSAPGVELNAYLMKPPGFDPARRYPLVMYVYGGPGSQTVLDAWGGNLYLWHLLLTREGYLVASVDNRGTGARGTRFKKVTYLGLGTYETADQVAAARHFATLAFVDAERIGIWGGSYGGYMSLLSLFKGEGVFKAAVARAPVTDWRLYDTIYTERYMRTPEENPDGYRRGAPQSYVGQFRGNLLLVHGTGDDNVHPQNTMQLIHLLEESNKQFDLRLYPNKTHAISGASTQVNLYSLYLEWWKKNL